MPMQLARLAISIEALTRAISSVALAIERLAESSDALWARFEGE